MSRYIRISPNDAKSGSFVWLAEEWLLSKGGEIPLKSKFPRMFQGMLDDYTDQYDPDAEVVT